MKLYRIHFSNCTSIVTTQVPIMADTNGELYTFFILAIAFQQSTGEILRCLRVQTSQILFIDEVIINETQASEYETFFDAMSSVQHGKELIV
jgi:hypothetical protein